MSSGGAICRVSSTPGALSEAGRWLEEPAFEAYQASLGETTVQRGARGNGPGTISAWWGRSAQGAEGHG